MEPGKDPCLKIQRSNSCGRQQGTSYSKWCTAPDKHRVILHCVKWLMLYDRNKTVCSFYIKWWRICSRGQLLPGGVIDTVAAILFWDWDIATSSVQCLRYSVSSSPNSQTDISMRRSMLFIFSPGLFCLMTTSLFGVGLQKTCSEIIKWPYYFYLFDKPNW